MSGAASLPVTVVTGFLGAGKTTLVARALAEARAAGRRVAVVVNDLGGPSVDAETLRRHHAAEAADLVALSGGSVGSGLAPALRDALADLPARGYDAALVETSGSADPAAVIEAVRDAPGVHLARTVALLDARALALDWGDGRALFSRLVADESAGTASPAWLLMRQLSAADTVLVTKADLVDETALRAAVVVAGQLAPHAALRASVRGEGGGEVLFAPGAADADAALARLAATRPADATAAGLAAETVRSRRPVHPARLHRLVSEGLPAGLFRLKGALWLVSRPDAVLHAELAASRLEIELAGVWKAAVLAGPARLSAEERAALRAGLAHAVFGDRETELVLLGVPAAVREAAHALRRCLCTDAEVARWQRGRAFADPFPTRLRAVDHVPTPR